jgi:CRISPR/Cas system endoribonuclease Cas6 (RAMP superfamily)
MSFAEISNVGGNRTAGFGVVEYRRAEECSSSQG